MNDVVYQLSPELHALADRWPVYPSTFEVVWAEMVDGEPVRRMRLRACERCAECELPILPPDEPYRMLQHLVAMHGYRMDGRQWDNQNREIGHARDAHQPDPDANAVHGAQSRHISAVLRQVREPHTGLAASAGNMPHLPGDQDAHT